MLPDFFIIPTEIALDEELQPLDGYVYAIVYWYTRLKLERCTASNQTIANILSTKFKKKKSINAKSVSNSLQRLSKRNFVKIVLNVLHQRVEIIPLISFNSNPTSNNVGTNSSLQKPVPNPPTSNDVTPSIISCTPPTSNDGQNNNILIPSNIKKDKDNVNTNVLTQGKPAEVEKKQFGDPVVNALCEVFEKAYGHLPSKADQRKYSKLIINKFGENIALRGAVYAIEISSDEFAPKITCPRQLWFKWSDMVAYGKKGLKPKSRTVNVSELIRQKKGTHVT